jgi:hypothetical protein
MWPVVPSLQAQELGYREFLLAKSRQQPPATRGMREAALKFGLSYKVLKSMS